MQKTSDTIGSLKTTTFEFPKINRYASNQS